METDIMEIIKNVNFPIVITTAPDISSMNLNNIISVESFRRFQQWKHGIDHKHCWLNDEVDFQHNQTQLTFGRVYQFVCF